MNDKQRAIELLKLYREILHQGQVAAVDNSAETGIAHVRVSSQARGLSPSQ
ncbi:hypothetical protein H6S82_14930 [Planktothrix sp. FACHB-1355]|uniref:Uncharacterized protein n=1 Tax=Aerosakkonema funiforme FACHB-1375 TaxID=2949571 RepID=A0A926VI28_9CYAN|nr:MULTISPECIES: hypothetical protein [Oscillatoriales]MBD2183029.1 hypothetical protein [Aerosakkonema funiforme FACHB-1375]MBD3560139.1 hypothetical protein [Planktothrix sp. FACHB-1355]